MSIRASKSNLRSFVILNYFSMFALIAVIYAGEMYYGGTTFIAVAAISLMLLTVLTFVFLHARTRLWWLTHTKIENLDERQQEITHESLRTSYSIYTVLTLGLLFVIALIAHDYDPNLIVAFAALHYLAHTLPGAILAWRQKEV